MSENQTDINSRKSLSVLITGGSGLVGRYLTSALLSEGYNVSHLSRNANQFGKVRVHRWDPEKGILDPIAFWGVDYIIHLAGANIGEKRWTKRRRDEIIKSRIESVKLLHKVITANHISLKAFISASAIGYYGSVSSDRIFNEDDPSANDFLGKTCRQWEEGADHFQNSGIRTVKIRTAVVLEKSDSALSKMMMPAKFGFLVQTGNGKQFMPWIHIADLCGIYLKALKDFNMTGPYNAVSPQHVTHKEFIITLAKVMNKPVFPFPVPGFILRAALGLMSDVVLKGSRVSSGKIENAGYSFKFSNLHDALNEAINS
jgi:uncharacterized protein (TIGR01777 family)